MGDPVCTHVLVGWDGSWAAAEGLRLGVALTGFPGGVVTAVSVVPSFDHLEAEEDRRRALDEARLPLQAAYDEVVTRLPLHPEQQASLRFLESARVGEALDAYTAAHRVDMLIVGLHGREGILHPKMGHVTSHVATSSRCPVLLVPDRPAGGTVGLDSQSHLAGALRGMFRHSKTAHRSGAAS